MYKALVVITIASGVLVWLAASPARHAVTAAVSLANPAAPAQSPEPIPSVIPPVVRLTSAPEEPRWLTGTVIVDDGRGSPGIPYIAYTDSSGNYRTKQLVWSGTRGCRADAGDLPCAPSTGITYPQFPAGTRVRVYGSVDADRFVIEDVESGTAVY